ADFFPTLTPFKDGFFVLSLPGVLERVNTADTVTEWGPNEVWLQTGLDGPRRDALLANLKSQNGITVIDRQALETTYRSDPLIAAGWRGILAMAFGAVVFVTLLGFAIYSYVQAQRRRAQFALLRGMGLSTPGLVGIVALEQTVIIVVGLGLGSWMGYQLTSLLMPFLGLTEEGTKVLPPYAASINWPAIIATYAVIAGVYLVTTLALAGFFARFAIQRALRFGEM
ncbi:MAG: hypothetical protein HY261_09095, partial [Chloroflexi bacterium]|nr:hypothetical protein [Chloroflexota bacterium]